MNTPVLEAKHLGIAFGGLKAVDDFNITINEGELVGLIGVITSYSIHYTKLYDFAFVSIPVLLRQHISLYTVFRRT